MRAFKILPKTVFISQIKSLSNEGLRRLVWMDWYFLHGKNAEATCRHFSLSKSVFYRWLNRFNKWNLTSLESRSTKPKNVRCMTTPTWIRDLICTLRSNDPEKSKYEIQAELLRLGIKIGYNTVQKVISRHPELLLVNVNHQRQLRKHRNHAIARIKAARELREKNLGSLVQIDTKHLYIMGIRFYLFVAIDCRSRLGFIWAYKTGSSLSAADFLLKVIRYFPFKIMAVNTDNGSEYLLNFHKLCLSLEIDHYFTYPNTPKMNARAERLIQTAEYEFFNWQDDLLSDIEMINQRCKVFNEKYNTQRFHQSLGYKTPQEYVNSYLLEKGGKPFSMYMASTLL